MKRGKKSISRAQKAKRFARIKKIVSALLTASILLFLAVFFTFIPFRILLPAYGLPAREEGELRLHFLDLAGGVTIVEFPDGELLVVNAGDGSFAGDNKLCRYLRALDGKALSLLATDPDSSHVGGMPALFETFDVKKTYLPAFGSDSGAYRRFLSALDKEGCERERLARYGVIGNSSGAYAVCLSPYSEEEEDAEGDASTVLFLSYAGVNAVLSGGVSARREKKLVTEYSLLDSVFDSGECRVRLDETQILLAPSHGSDGGSSEEWLALLRPAATVICCNRNETPSDNALARIVTYSDRVYRTDELGAVMISVGNGGYRVRTHMTD